MVLPKPARPVSFAGLMTLYESNYVRLNWLLPQLPNAHTCLVSTTNDDAPLYLRVDEVCRYTTTMTLTYLFRDPDGLVADPDLRVRVYHDAMMVEAMGCTERHRHQLLQGFRTGHGSELVQRWQRNMMLNKWLEYCADHGHQFAHLYPEPAS
ncbi:MAG: DUF1249 domain-containing protein [Gammaproteobacteria bacterium]|nr:DUF1249 domain-containing protein [Gammaproteobacteria bacterium]